MPCPICQYNMVKNLDRLILAGADPADLSRRYPFTPEELARHAEHLHHKMALAQKRFQAALHQGLFCKLHTVMEMTFQVVRRTKTAEDPRLFFQAGREFTRIVALMDKMATKIHFDPEFIYCLMDSPQWDLQEDTLLPYAFQALSQTRSTLKQQFFFNPCPEPEPALSSPPAAGQLAPHMRDACGTHAGQKRDTNAAVAPPNRHQTAADLGGQAIMTN